MFLGAQAQINNPWVVPEEYKEMKNPVKSDKKSIHEGEKVYAQHCLLCHGATGQGNGEWAENLDVDPSDLTFDDIDAQTDGELYYKLTTGQGEMHAVNDQLDENQIWSVINYIRTFYKK